MSLPLCVAAKILNIKIYLFEPNMVLGRANKLFLRFCEKIFCYSSNIKNFTKKFINKIILIDPLIRKEFYSVKIDENFVIKDHINLLIIGGSQGAKLFDTELEKSILILSQKYKLKIFQQTNISNFINLRNFYIKHNIHNELFNFDKNIAHFISKTNFCVTRAGASTLSELSFLNIPHLSIPFPFAKDNHQYENALFYLNKNCCWLIKQEDLKEGVLSQTLVSIIENKEDYSAKKKSMKNFSYKNTWNNINQKLISVINEN
jgi:UDP-N-acetylglucosamine--N-acetylmuramyl-(pentapeptide) pyrophosphoryl-undecaprenol N-acetylglucosamine transferase